MSVRERVDSQTETGYPPAEELSYLFASVGEGDVTVTLLGGETYSVEAIGADWGDIVHLDLLELDRDEFHERLISAGLDQSFIFLFIVTPEPPNTEGNVVYSILYSDSETVGLLEQLGKEMRWDFGEFQVLPPDIKKAVEIELLQLKEDKEWYFQAAMESDGY